MQRKKRRNIYSVMLNGLAPSLYFDSQRRSQKFKLNQQDHDSYTTASYRDLA